MRFFVYLFIFFVTLHSTLALYTNSTFLDGFFGPYGIAIAYTLSALVTIVALHFSNRLATAFGATRLAVFAAVAEATALVGLATLTVPELLIGCFIAIQALTAILFYVFDVFLETYSKDSSTGGVRGTYLTVINAAFLIGPLAGTQAIDRFGYDGVYLAGAGIIGLVAIATGIAFAHFQDPVYAPPRVMAVIDSYRKKPDLALVTLSFFLLWCFYVVAIVHVPIYLTSVIGLSTQQLGYVLAIGLIPFVLIQMPLGKLADTSFGEKEFMFAGFFLMAAAGMLVPELALLGIVPLVAAIFIGRLGAAAVEVMCDSFFFKHVSAEDSGTIAAYRSMMYVAYAIVPLIMIPIVSSLGYQASFPIAAAFALGGIPFALAMQDTK